jgi:hypothetical protein
MSHISTQDTDVDVQCLRYIMYTSRNINPDVDYLRDGPAVFRWAETHANSALRLQGPGCIPTIHRSHRENRNMIRGYHVRNFRS